MIKTRCTGASKLDCERMYTGFLSISVIQDQHFVIFACGPLPICILKIMKATLWISFQEVAVRAIPFMKLDGKCPVTALVSGRVP